MDIELSKINDAFICILYKSYLDKKESGASLAKARRIGSISNLRELLPNWQDEDIEVCCGDLKKDGLLSVTYADDTVWDSSFTEKGIIYMENRFKDKVKNVIEYVKTIASFIPFVPFG